jgi:hypothetical protein
MSGKCPGEEAIATDPTLRTGKLEGDVDGDGDRDKVSMAKTKGKPDCSNFLVVETDDEVFSIPLASEGGGIALGIPSLKGLAQIDGRPGVDVYVTMLSGASTEFLSVFSAGGGKLERLDVEGSYGPLFPSGASVTHAEASDCREGPGKVVIVALNKQDPQGWVGQWSYFRFDGHSFVRDGEAITTDPIGRIQRNPEFRHTPFGSCPTSAS